MGDLLQQPYVFGRDLMQFAIAQEVGRIGLHARVRKYRHEAAQCTDQAMHEHDRFWFSLAAFHHALLPRAARCTSAMNAACVVSFPGVSIALPLSSRNSRAPNSPSLTVNRKRGRYCLSGRVMLG